VITPTESEIIPPGEIGDLNMVSPRRSPPTIDVKANSTVPTAAEREAKRQAINMPDQRHKHRMFDVMVEGVAVPDAFERKLGQRRDHFTHSAPRGPSRGP
jgi:hypothetical protein